MLISEVFDPMTAAMLVQAGAGQSIQQLQPYGYAFNWLGIAANQANQSSTVNIDGDSYFVATALEFSAWLSQAYLNASAGTELARINDGWASLGTPVNAPTPGQLPSLTTQTLQFNISGRTYSNQSIVGVNYCGRLARQPLEQPWVLTKGAQAQFNLGNFSPAQITAQAVLHGVRVWTS